MSAHNERIPADGGRESNFMETLKKELADDEAVMQRANKRLRNDPNYSGPPRRRGERQEEPSVGQLVDHAEKKAKPWIKLGGLAFAALSILGTWGVLNNPFEMKAQAQEAHAAINKRIDESAARLGKVEGRLDSIDRNQTRALALQLRAERRALEEELRSAPEGRARALLQTQLDRVEEDMKALGEN